MKKVILCPNPSRDDGFAISREVERMLRKNGIETSLRPMPDHNSADGETFESSALSDELDGENIIIAFGGDGTILRAARAAAGREIVILGVNLGGKGFMAELERDDIGVIPGILSGGYATEARMMLDIELRRGGDVVCENFALNDVVVGGIAKVVDITLRGDGGVISRFRGDGAVIATPTGSTAYSLSAGGPIVEPSARNILITPVCAHTLKVRPFVLAAERLVSVQLGGRGANPAYMSVDGSQYVELYGGDIVNVRQSRKHTYLMRLPGGSFYRKVSEKLGESI
jgi:NAD+ kinase